MIASSPYPQHERYAIRRRLGAGGMGVVYEAFDRERKQIVALKTLRWIDAAAVYRFKREFRSLTNVRHRNLVTLYELSAHNGEWFFTMEKVEGVDFQSYVDSSSGNSDNASQTSGRRRIVNPPGISRLRDSFLQLVQGLTALHAAGKVHRDVKPTNVLVTARGRVVLLDFGLTADSGLADPFEVTADWMWGTARYMAPEYGNGPPSPAADWYAVGTMLYEALTGQSPFAGGPSTILKSKWQSDGEPPQSPHELIQGLPDDLVSLCMTMLERDPGRRPDGTSILRQFDAKALPMVTYNAAESGVKRELIGRTREVAHLRAALEAARSGHSAVVLLSGPSGIGKSALLAGFRQNALESPDVVLLSGRCYSREHVPDKALDAIVESLCGYLRKASPTKRHRLIPRHVDALVFLFPALRQALQLSPEDAHQNDDGDRLELRNRGYSSLSDLLRRIAREHPLVIQLDDLQWADNESVLGLCHVLENGSTSGMAIIMAYRNGWRGEDSLSHRLTESGSSVRRVELGPLQESAVRQILAKQWRTDQLSSTHTERIIRESQGNPFLVEQLVRHACDPAGSATSGVDLKGIVNTRIEWLGDDARRVMEAVSVAGHPTGLQTVRKAANLSCDEREVVASLEVSGLVRLNDGDQLEPLHDQIRQAVLSGLHTDHVRQIHYALATALRQEDVPRHDLLFEHYLAAQDTRRASAHAEQAAEQSTDSLRFERSIRFYSWALRLGPGDPDSIARLSSALAAAFSAAGRLSEAADAYMNAAACAKGNNRIELNRLGAEHMLLSGRIEEGLREISSVLRAAGLTMKRSRRKAVLSLVFNRMCVRGNMALRQVYVPRGRHHHDHSQVDVCKSVAEGLAHLDFLHSADFQARHVRLALMSGDPERMARALAIEAGFSMLRGTRSGYRRATRLLERAESLAARVGSPATLGLCALMSGIIRYFRGEWTMARDATASALAQLRGKGFGVAWEIMTSQLYHTLSLFYAGDIRVLVTQADSFLEDAERRGNRFASTIVRTGPANVIWLVKDDPAGAWAALRSALASWPERPFRTPHFLAATAAARIRLYEGDGERALQIVQDSWNDIRSTGLLRIQALRVIAWHLRGTCLLAAARGRPELVRAALGEATRMRREKRPWCRAMALILEAQVALQRDEEAATGLLRQAVASLERGGMLLHANAARRQLGKAVGGVHGERLISEADRWMDGQGIRNPRRMTAMVFPSPN